MKQPVKGDRAAELIGDLQIELTEEDVCHYHPSPLI